MREIEIEGYSPEVRNIPEQTASNRVSLKFNPVDNFVNEYFE